MKILLLLLLTTLTTHAQMFTFGTGKQPGSTTPSVGNYYVGGAGASDSNTGTSISPFATITKAGQVAVAGDVVIIRSGTYRETITPTNSGSSGNVITYQADAGATVIIDGREDVGSSGWTVHSGSIYKKTISLPVTGFGSITTNTTLAANQIFKDGVMQIENRWPNFSTVADLFDRTKWRQRASTTTFTGTTISDSGLPDTSGSLRRIIDAGWYVHQSSTITSSASGSITYNSLPNTGTDFLQMYFITGAPELVDVAGEWFYDGTTLYYYSASGSPTGMTYKARNYGFDLSGKTNITIENIDLFACEITGNTSTDNITLDGMNITYANHTVTHPSGDFIYTNSIMTGTRLYGSSNVVTNCHFIYSGSTGVWLGASGRVENNLFESMGYDGNYGSPVMFYGNISNNQKVLRNTFHDIGRSAIDFGWDSDDPDANRGTHTNVEIGYNNIYAYGKLSADGGGAYAGRYWDLRGSRLHHNWVHNSSAVHYPAPADVGINAGFYFDQMTAAGVIIDHNVMWDNKQCDLHLVTGELINSGLTWYGKARVYNNTLVSNSQGTNQKNGYYSVLNVSVPDTTMYDVHRNNIYRARAIYGYTTDTSLPYTSPNPWYYEAGPSANLGTVYGGESPSTMWNNSTNNLYMATVYRPSYTLQGVKFAGDPTDAVQDVGTVADPGAYFQLESTSPARGIGVTLTGYNNSDTAPKDAGAYYYSQTPWNAGQNCTNCP